MTHPVTPDGRYFVLRGRLWRMSNPAARSRLPGRPTTELMAARRDVGAALRAGSTRAEKKRGAEWMPQNKLWASADRRGGPTALRTTTGIWSRTRPMQAGMRRPVSRASQQRARFRRNQASDTRGVLSGEGHHKARPLAGRIGSALTRLHRGRAKYVGAVVSSGPAVPTRATQCERLTGKRGSPSLSNANPPAMPERRRAYTQCWHRNPEKAGKTLNRSPRRNLLIPAKRSVNLGSANSKAEREH